MNTPERTYAGQQDLLLGTDDRVTRITPASRAARGVNQHRYLDLFSFAVLLGCRWNGLTIVGSKGAEGHLRLAASYGKGVTRLASAQISESTWLEPLPESSPYQPHQQPSQSATTEQAGSSRASRKRIESCIPVSVSSIRSFRCL